MDNKSNLVRVPATIGNFGGAEDCAALALDATLNVKVTPRADGAVGIRYFGENGERVPRDRTNLVVRAMEATLHLARREFSGADFEIYSSVPVAVGLGSSTAAVLAGVISADRLYGLGVDEKTILDLASIYESRSDNLQAAWLGGFVAFPEEDGRLMARRALVPTNFSISVVAPDAPLTARGVETSPGAARVDSAWNAERASAIAAFFSRPDERALKDLFTPLPPTCEKRVPGLEDALQVQSAGVLMTFVCGSGPAVGIMTEDNPESAIQAVRDRFLRAGVRTTHGTFRPANTGARDWNAMHAEVAPAVLSSGRNSTKPRPQ